MLSHMTEKQEKALSRMGLFKTEEAEKLGLSRPDLSRLVQNEIILRVGRGIYIHKSNQTSADIGFKIACAKFGTDAAIGGLSALFHYNLIEQVPQQTWVLVPPNTKTKEKGYRLMRTKANLNKGVISKDGYKIVSVERALLEALRFSSKIGERTALGAVRKAFSQKLTNEGKLGRMAKELGLFSVVAKNFEAIVA